MIYETKETYDLYKREILNTKFFRFFKFLNYIVHGLYRT